MEKTTYAARLRYLDADDVDDDVVDYDGLDVYGSDDHKIGNIDGFIVDPEARRLNYVVIDSGGWFTSRRLLLPVGHATIAADGKSLQTDVTQDALRRLPEYHEDRFQSLSDEELRAFERNTVVACCPDEPLEDVSVTQWGYDTRKHYQQPSWWQNSRYAPERLRPIGGGAYRVADPSAPVAGASGAGRTPAAPVQAQHERDRVIARGDEDRDASPHPEGRAQPGDILGIETAGERTGIGDTAEDENKRREQAERATRDKS